MTRPLLLGAVLAGGKSRRYGQPKHAVPVGGVPMVARAVAALGPVTGTVVVISSRRVEGAGDTPVLPDLVPDRGPLGGLHAALHAAVDRGLAGVILLACDMPLVDEAVLEALVGASGASGDAHALHPVAPTRSGGGVEPLCAVYPVELLPEVESRLKSDDLSLHALLREAGGTSLDLGGDAFLNVNTPEGRDRAEAALRERTST